MNYILYCYIAITYTYKRDVPWEVKLFHMPDFPELMGMGDVMRYLKVSRQYVDHLVDTGKLRCKKLSTGKVFLATDVLVFQSERQQRKAAKKVTKKKRA